MEMSKQWSLGSFSSNIPLDFALIKGSRNLNLTMKDDNFTPERYKVIFMPIAQVYKNVELSPPPFSGLKSNINWSKLA